MAAIGLTFLALVARPALAQISATQAEVAEQENRLDEAIDRLELARRLDPMNGSYLLPLARLYFRTNSITEGITRLERLVAVQPDHAQNHVNLGWAYWLSGDLEAAVQQFETAVEVDPWDAMRSRNHTALGLAYAALNRRAEAIDAFKQGFLVTPESVRGATWAAVVLPSTGVDRVLHLSEASLRQLLRSSSRVNQSLTNATPPLTLPAANQPLYISEVFDSAYADYKELRSSDPERAQQVLSTLARLHIEVGDAERALDLLTELLTLAPDESYVYYDLGQAHVALGSHAEAKKAFQEVLTLAERSRFYDVREPFAHLQLGLIYLEESNDEEALQELRAALDTYRWPYFPEAYEALAVAESRNGHTADAEAVLRRLAFLLNQ